MRVMTNNTTNPWAAQVFVIEDENNKYTRRIESMEDWTNIVLPSHSKCTCPPTPITKNNSYRGGSDGFCRMSRLVRGTPNERNLDIDTLFKIMYGYCPRCKAIFWVGEDKNINEHRIIWDMTQHIARELKAWAIFARWENPEGTLTPEWNFPE